MKRSIFLRIVITLLLVGVFFFLILSGVIPIPHAGASGPEETANGPAIPEFFIHYEGSKQIKVCNNCSLIYLGVVVHTGPQTKIPLYIRFTTTYIPIKSGLGWYDVYTEGSCVDIISSGAGPSGFEVYAKITCKSQQTPTILAVRYRPLELNEWPVKARYTDSGNWDLRHDADLTIKVKQDPWISSVVPSSFSPGQIVALEGRFDQYADAMQVAFRTGNNVPANFGEILEITEAKMVVQTPKEFLFPTEWEWNIFVLFREDEESDFDWRMSNWVPVTILGERTYSPLILR